MVMAQQLHSAKLSENATSVRPSLHEVGRII
jgi:hypothetical protein